MPLCNMTVSQMKLASASQNCRQHFGLEKVFYVNNVHSQKLKITKLGNTLGWFVQKTNTKP